MRALRSRAALAAVLAVVGLAVLAVPPMLGLALPAEGDSSSIAGAGQAGWTTPPSGSLQDAPEPVTSTWTGPAAPPAPPPSVVVDATPYGQAPAPSAPPAPVAAPERTWAGCGMPCSDGISMWYLTGVFGRAWQAGDDHAEECWYWGFDLGRTFCGCWGLDLFYRYHSGQFERENQGQPAKDGGAFHHVGLKFTYDFPISGRLYGWAGVGPEYFWTEGYLDDDSGFAVFGELGVGYVLNRNLRVRAGVNLHWMDTDVTRRLPQNDGQSRDLWVIAPVVELEFAF